MIDVVATQSEVFPRLEDSVKLLRALRSPSWLDKVNKRANTIAFKRIPVRDSHGLSFNIMPVCSIEGCADKLTSCHGVISMFVSQIRDVRIDETNAGLDVIQDSVDHANAAGLPYSPNPPSAPPVTEDEYRSERLATILRDLSKLEWFAASNKEADRDYRVSSRP